MSILNRLQTLFRRGDKEEDDSKVKTEEEVKVTSSKKKLNNNKVSGTKTSERISKAESSSKNIPSQKDKKEPTVKEDKKPQKVDEKPKTVEKPAAEEVEEPEKAVEEPKSSNLVDEEDSKEEELEESDNENTNKERDNMTLLTDKELVTSENLDKDFTAEFIDAGIETVKNCFQCGTCGGTCPSGKRTPYKVRQLVRKCLLGLKEDVISDDALWMCTTCYTCQERCPRSVKIVDIVKKARNIAAHAGYMAKPHKMTGLFVIKTGHGVPINPATKELRERVGLGELPPTTHKFPEALEEVQKICKITGFDELIGYDEATGDLKE